jgi:hypothetical protein
VAEIRRGLRGVEDARRRRRASRTFRGARERLFSPRQTEDELLRAVARGEHLLLEPRDRLGARDDADSVDRPVDEALREVASGLGAHLLAGHELALHEIEASGPRRRHRAIVVGELDRERRIGCEREAHASRGLLEGDVDARDAVAASRLLEVRDVRHGAVVELRRDVRVPLPGEVERGHALLASAREGRVRGVLAVDHERMIVAERRAGQIADPRDAERSPLGRQTHTRAVDIARPVRCLASEEQREAAEHEIGEKPTRRLPSHVLGANHRRRCPSQIARERSGVRRHRTRVEQRRCQAGDAKHDDQCLTAANCAREHDAALDRRQSSTRCVRRKGTWLADALSWL